MPTAKPYKSRILFLDYLRVFAFLSVLIGHKFATEISTYLNSLHIHQYIKNIIWSMCEKGGAGVIVFFMISGYIILHILQKEFPFEFLIKRVFRIYPLLTFAILTQIILAYSINDIPINIPTTLLQMSLIGDFFNTPYALGEVEWTLRIEIIFYLIMFIFSFTLLLRHKGYTLLFLFTLITLFVSLEGIAPFPRKNFVGYVSTFLPFLFLGSVVYMYEKKRIHLFTVLLFIGLVFYQYFKAIENFSPQLLHTNFAITGFIIFILFWFVRKYINLIPYYINFFITKLALLTFSIYLFHLFLWPYIEMLLISVGFHSNILILTLLFIWCSLMYITIEIPMNKLGKILSNKFKHKEQIL